MFLITSARKSGSLLEDLFHRPCYPTPNSQDHPQYCNILTTETFPPHSIRVLWIPKTISSPYRPRPYHCVSVCNLGVHSLFNYRPHLPDIQVDCLQAFCTISIPQAQPQHHPMNCKRIQPTTSPCSCHANRNCRRESHQQNTRGGREDLRH